MPFFKRASVNNDSFPERFWPFFLAIGPGPCSMTDAYRISPFPHLLGRCALLMVPLLISHDLQCCLLFAIARVPLFPPTCRTFSVVINDDVSNPLDSLKHRRRRLGFLPTSPTSFHPTFFFAKQAKNPRLVLFFSTDSFGPRAGRLFLRVGTMTWRK